MSKDKPTLTNTEQAYLMTSAFVIPPVATWLSLGAPIDNASLALLAAGIVSGAIAFIKEILG